MNKKTRVSDVYWFAGIVAVIVYLVGIIVGGLLYPGYSHISQDISQLTSTESPIRTFMNLVFWPYNVLVGIVGVGLYRISTVRTARIASWFIIFIGMLGVMIAFFPINTRGTAITFVGICHIVIVSLVSLMTIASQFLFWYAYRHTHDTYFARLSLCSGVGFLLSGPVAGLMVLSPYAGVAERIPIGIFLTWILATAYYFGWKRE